MFFGRQGCKLSHIRHIFSVLLVQTHSISTTIGPTHERKLASNLFGSFEGNTMASPPNLKSNVVDMNLDLPSELLLLANNAIRKSPPPLHSSCFEVRFTPYTGGLGAFASTTIPTGTQVFMAEEPFVSVVYAPFKKEVCAYCFAYDRGRKMKQVERSTVAKDSRGIAWFCTTECHRQWRDRYGDLGTAAISRVTAALSKTQKSGSEQCTSDRLTTNDIEVAWNQADKARSSKAAPVLFQDDDQDTLYFLLDGIISRAVRPDAWDTFLSLIPSLQPYSDTSTLQSHIRMLHFLRHHVPPALQSFCTAETFLALITRDHGNSFGIFEDELGRDTKSGQEAVG
jgi:hypothetical protein